MSAFSSTSAMTTFQKVTEISFQSPPFCPHAISIIECKQMLRAKDHHGFGRSIAEIRYTLIKPIFHLTVTRYLPLCLRSWSL